MSLNVFNCRFKQNTRNLESGIFLWDTFHLEKLGSVTRQNESTDSRVITDPE
jgi:hypothetical protein